MDDLENLKADPINWIMSNIEDDLSGIEWVVDEMDVDAILDPALEAYIIPQFKKAGIAVPERTILTRHIEHLIKRISEF